MALVPAFPRHVYEITVCEGSGPVTSLCYPPAPSWLLEQVNQETVSGSEG